MEDEASQPVCQNGIKYKLNEINGAKVIGCSSEVRELFIPRSIKSGTQEFIVSMIDSNSFYNSQITLVRFAADSELKTIECDSFRSSSLLSIYFPSHIESIGSNSFNGCKNLRTVDIPYDGELKIIEMYAFCDTAIESITIPSLLIDIEEGWCADTLKLNKFNVASNNHFFFCI